ncbi:MAG: DUF72 domain-containing protein, partial [Bacteroidota bacterium]
TGWSMKEWVGKVYPDQTKAKDFLKHYARQFNTIELNATHYRIPNEATILKCKTETPDDFRFCPKIPQSVSHSRDLGLETGHLQRFCAMIAQLDRRLGCCFMQLPPYFGTDRLGMLERFLTHFPQHIPLAIELRHESWFADRNSADDLFQLLETHHMATVITDVAGRRDVLHQRLTNNCAMLRFVGNALHSSDYERVDAWVQQFKDWIEQGLSNIYFFAHEPDNILSPDLALYFKNQMEEHIEGLITRGPTFYQHPSDLQMRLF